MWNTFSTDAVPGINSRLVTMSSMMGDEINAYLARQDGPGPYPGVVLIPHAGGFDEILFEYAGRFAMHGFTTIVPNIFARYGHGAPDDVTARARTDNGLGDDTVVADAHGALRYLNALPNSNGKVGVIGFCSGGRHAVLSASLVPEFNAVADCWGGGVIQTPEQTNAKRPVAPIDLTAQLNAPIIGIFGNEDMGPSPAQVNQHEEVLQAAGKTYQFHRYDGVGHGIWYFDRPNYRQPAAAIDSWNKVEDWFNQYLGG